MGGGGCRCRRCRQALTRMYWWHLGAADSGMTVSVFGSSHHLRPRNVIRRLREAGIQFLAWRRPVSRESSVKIQCCPRWTSRSLIPVRTLIALLLVYASSSSTRRPGCVEVGPEFGESRNRARSNQPVILSARRNWATSCHTQLEHEYLEEIGWSLVG